jgi:protocatechuate 3,4-dioxygenase beta subunit
MIRQRAGGPRSGSYISNMTDNNHGKPTRRRFLLRTGTLVAAFGMVRAEDALAQELPATPACHDGDEPTVRQTEGPFYKPRSPARMDLREAGGPGSPTELAGLVLDRRCRPLSGAVVDLWHADERGEYDNAGFRYRGHVVTGADGSYRFRTIMPAVYRGRTRHYHFKVQSPGSRLLTTQLYFPTEPENQRDGLFRRELLMRVADSGDSLAARFDFVLDLR